MLKLSVSAGCHQVPAVEYNPSEKGLVVPVTDHLDDLSGKFERRFRDAIFVEIFPARSRDAHHSRGDGRAPFIIDQTNPAAGVFQCPLQVDVFVPASGLRTHHVVVMHGVGLYITGRAAAYDNPDGRVVLDEGTADGPLYGHVLEFTSLGDDVAGGIPLEFAVGHLSRAIHEIFPDAMLPEPSLLSFHRVPLVMEPSAPNETLFFQMRLLSKAQPAMRL